MLIQVHNFGRFLQCLVRINTLAISPDSQSIFSGSDDQFIKVFDIKSGELKDRIGQAIKSQPPEGDLAYPIVEVAPNNEYFVTCSVDDRSIKVFGLPLYNYKHTFHNVHDGISL